MEDIEKTPMVKKSQKFGTKERIYWASASLGGSIINGIYGSMLSIFIVDYLGLVNAEQFVYILSFIYLAINALNDPIVGIWSDRTRADKGRRIPFMRYTVPFIIIAFILIWLVPLEIADIGKIIWLIIATALYDTAYTIIFLVYSALLPEITEDEKERNGLQIFASFFNLIGQILGFLIPEFFRGGGSLFPLQMAMVAFGILGGVLILFTTYKFKERPEFTKVDQPLGFSESIKYTFRSKSFKVLVSANFFQILMQSLVIGSMFYLADYVVQQSTVILLAFVFIPILIGIWITPKFIDKFGVARSQQLLLFIAGTGLLLLVFMPDLVTIGISLAIAGFGFVGPLVYTNVLFAQVADEDEIKTGVRREGVFFGINALITKPAQSFSLILPTFFLSLANFIPRNGGPPVLPQPAGVDIAIRVFIGLIPGLALIIAGLILQLYPLKGDYLQEVKQKVLEMHKEKEEKLRAMERA